MDWTCQACGDKEPGTRYPVIEKLSDRDQKEIYVCEICLPHFERVEYLIQRSDGQIFPRERGPKPWKNDVVLHYTHNHIVSSMLEAALSRFDENQRAKYLQECASDFARLPLDDFPFVEDFEVCLESPIAKHEVNRKRIPYFFAHLYSPSLGYLGSFSGDDESHSICRSDFVIPHGDFTLPYYDLEQGIDLLIAEDDQFVYILFGNWELHNYPEPGVGQRIENYYDSWVKVKRERYYEQWEIAIEWSRVYHARDTLS